MSRPSPFTIIPLPYHNIHKTSILHYFLLQINHMEPDQDHEVNSLNAILLGAEQEGERGEVGPKGMSKRQEKKLIRKEKWEKEKGIRRKQKREKEKAKKKDRRLKQAEKAVPQQSLGEGQGAQEVKGMRKRREDYVEKMKEGVVVVIDLQFYELMREKEQNSLIRQLSHCHSENRKAERCFNFMLTSVTKEMREFFNQKYNIDNWGISVHQQSVTDLFPPQKLVYLTGDAQESVECLSPERVFVIGGIVDHNRLKQITYNYAVEHKIEARRLPMHTVKLKASVHLAVNHVWEWMLKQHNGLSWDQSLKSVLPSRKVQTYQE